MSPCLVMSPSPSLSLLQYMAPDMVPLAYPDLPRPPSHRQACINAFVYVHQTLHQANARLAKRGGATMTLTPRHYLDFISHYVSLRDCFFPTLRCLLTLHTTTKSLYSILVLHADTVKIDWVQCMSIFQMCKYWASCMYIIFSVSLQYLCYGSLFSRFFASTHYAV